ncbi:ThiF family adenylyltransferase [Marinovum sp. SP66]|uniref:HesA/MoeB/ThiF family protein n=1 Tax=Marinovum TaxID=367771 RepID=UPI00237AEDF8|nr:HesA/MoeB/ThiF family protein [Marinovum sp. SP66]MDD9739412.1 ThiF family adenylyltransferase [Marinovum sp. SP66]
MTRYARQEILPEVGAAGQERLRQAHVVVIGAGGLGCPVLQYLAGAGVGRITLFDPDHVEESNLHRQPLYRMADLGRPKAEAAAEALRGFNPEVRLRAHVAPLGPGLAPGLVQAADLVIDAADSFAVSYILSDACLAAGTPLISASALGQSGYAGGFCGGAPSLRAVFPDLPTSGATCATAGVLGPAVGMIGSLQAQLALQLLLGTGAPLGRVVSVDLATMRFGGFTFLGSPEPARPWPFLAPAMLRPDDLVIELRDAAEAPCPITPEALRLPMEEVPGLTPAPGQRLVLCCASGLRAWRAGLTLKAQGIENMSIIAAKACA